jgi:Phosphotransferase enzyme family
MDDGLAAVEPLLPGVRLFRPESLSGNDRALVHRVAAEYPDGTRTSLITKQYQSAGEGWVRESAALTVLPRSIAAPRIVATQDAPPVLVLSDLGTGPSVADALLGRDAEAAARAVSAWAAAMAQLHAATVGLRTEFRAALDQRCGDLPVPDSAMGRDIEDAVRGLERACGLLDVPMPEGVTDEFRALATRLGASGLAALTPADACPDNNVLTAQGLALVDFEGAQWRHIAWDVAYLRVPWPSCWCSWRMPKDVGDRALDRYRDTAASAIPQVAEDGFDHDVRAAAVGWALITTTWFLDNALGSDPALNDKPTPTRRAMISHRLAAASRSTELPAAAELAGILHDVLADRWGDVPLAYAPAFRGAQ